MSILDWIKVNILGIYPDSYLAELRAEKIQQEQIEQSKKLAEAAIKKQEETHMFHKEFIKEVAQEYSKPEEKGPMILNSLTEFPEEEAPTTKKPDVDLDKMTKKQLITFADDNDIDIDKRNKKQTILDDIKKSFMC